MQQAVTKKKKKKYIMQKAVSRILDACIILWMNEPTNTLEMSVYVYIMSSTELLPVLQGIIQSYIHSKLLLKAAEEVTDCSREDSDLIKGYSFKPLSNRVCWRVHRPYFPPRLLIKSTNIIILSFF